MSASPGASAVVERVGGPPRTAVSRTAREQRLSDYFADRQQADARWRSWVQRHPLRALRAVQDLLAQPMLKADLSPSTDGGALRGTLSRKVVAGLTVGSVGACVLDVPADPSEYTVGAARQTLRRKVRAAQKSGVSWQLVQDRAERRRLQLLLDQSLAQKLDERYRQEDIDSSYLLDSDCWIVATSDAGEPLVLAVAPLDARWALLQCFVSLGDTRQHSDARYMLTQALVEELSRRGVRHLVDTRSAMELTNGLRHFQRMLGFRIVRVRASVTAAAVATAVPGRWQEGTAAARTADRRPQADPSALS